MLRTDALALALLHHELAAFTALPLLLGDLLGKPGEQALHKAFLPQCDPLSLHVAVHRGGELIFLKELLCGPCGILKLLPESLRAAIKHFLEELDVIYGLLEAQQVQ